MAIPENQIFSAAFMAESDAFKLEKEELLNKVDKLKKALSSRQNSELPSKFAELVKYMMPMWLC